jgi:RNA methyltransferase, TrmH family
MSTDISKNELRRVRALHRKKTREEQRCFIAEGKKVVEEALASDAAVISLYTTDPEFASQHRSASLVGSREMEQLSALQTPPGYLAVVQMPPAPDAAAWPDTVLALDGVRDPGNAGTMLRTADWFGVQRVISSADGVEWHNPKVVQATMGSLFRVQTAECDLVEALGQLRKDGYTVYCADMEGIRPDEIRRADKCVLVMGSESHGVRPEIRALADQVIAIPGAGRADSLNVSVAAGIILSRLFRG